MAKEICISSTPHETRLAILEDDQLAEIYYERENEYTLAGSIYNGRVTRVLPGMQSAFVDIGLERDAFLYVTDFLELEDPEETDELEQAAASGGTQPLREVRGGRSEERSQPPAQKPDARQEQKPEPKQEQRREQKPQEPRPERPSQDRTSQDRPSQDRSGQRRFAVEVVPPVEEESFAVAVEAYPAPPADESQDESGDAGARRWRGRRRRRSGRGGAGAAEQHPEVALEIAPDFPEEVPAMRVTPVDEDVEVAKETPAVAAPIFAAPAQTAPRAEQVPFVLPGESLSKYGGTAASESEEAEPAAPVRPASSYKPTTLIESPIEWDGSGLLPGESLSRHRHRALESEPAAEVDAEPRGIFSDAADYQTQAVPQDGIPAVPAYVEEIVEFAPAAEPFVEAVPEAAAVDDFVEEDLVEVELAEDEFEEEEQTADTATAEPVAESAAEELPEPDAAASHNVDPLPPTGFRLFGLGGKKKKDDKGANAEEDFIEEEAFAAPRTTAKSMPAAPAEPEIRRPAPRIPVKPEAKRILVDFDDNDDTFDNDEEDEGEEQPIAGTSAPESPRRDRGDRADRGGRGRRGRTGQPERQPERQSPPPMAAAATRRPPSRRSAQTSDLPIISDLLKPGQEILVQIAKEPIAQKGARITSHIALPGRFLVFMPTVSHIGVSRKIESDAERQRLKRILVSERGEASGGFIVRTAAEDASEEDLRADLRFLLHLWNEIKTRSDASKSPALIYHDLSLIERILRDQVSSNFSNIWVDSEAGYERIVRFLNHFSPTLTRRVKLYTKETPLFEHFGIQDEISKALRSKVWLKSGGSIVINQTEALVAIDINTGKYVGKSARLEDTIVKTNLDAVPEIVRQIRLRDLGGIIVIDFIDMDDRKNRYKVMAALEEALKSDRAPTKVLQFNDFGLVAITRKRVKQSLERTLSVPCPTCQATGMVKSPTTVCNEIYTELRKMKKHFEAEDILLRVNPETVKVLKANNAAWITEFEELVGKNILIKSDATLHPEQFDIQG